MIKERLTFRGRSFFLPLQHIGIEPYAIGAFPQAEYRVFWVFVVLLSVADGLLLFGLTFVASQPPHLAP